MSTMNYIGQKKEEFLDYLEKNGFFKDKIKLKKEESETADVEIVDNIEVRKIKNLFGVSYKATSKKIDSNIITGKGKTYAEAINDYLDKMEALRTLFFE